MNAEIQTLETDRDDLEDAASANMKRIKKLLSDLDAARKEVARASAAPARGGEDDGRLAELEADLADAQAHVAELQSKVDGADATSTGSTSQAVVDLVEELNSTISGFRGDFAQVTSAYEQIKSDDAEQRVEGMEQMQDGLDVCTGRSADMKSIVRELRDSL